MTARFSATTAAVIALPAGAIGVFAFAPFYFWPAALFSVAMLFVLWWQAPSLWRSLLATFCWCMGFFGAGVSWLYVSVHDFGEMPAWLAVPAIALFCIYLTSFVCVAAWVQHAVRRRSGAGPVSAILLIMPAAFVLGELLRGWVFGGFPWLTIGFSQTPGGFIQALLSGYAPLVGGFGISWLMAVMAGALVLFLMPAVRDLLSKPGFYRAVAAFFVIPTIGLLAGKISWSEPAGVPLTVALIQGNIDQRMKWREDEVAPTLELHRQMAESINARLIVMPETVAPIFLDMIPPDYLQALRSHAAKNGGDLLFGVPTQQGQGGHISIFNSVVSLGAAPQQEYSKSHLVIFGETTPPSLSWILNWLNIPMSGFTPGSDTQRPMQVAGQAVAINICYEDAFGDEVARQLPTAGLLVNVSNMAWFGHSLAAAQHGQMSQMRALETARWMLRATNTGLTAAINEHGEIVKALPQFTRGVLTVEAQPRQGTTPYVRWTDWPVRIGVVLLLGFCAFRGRKARKSG